MKEKGTGRLVEIRDGWNWRVPWVDSAILAGQLHWQQDGNPFPLRDIHD